MLLDGWCGRRRHSTSAIPFALANNRLSSHGFRTLWRLGNEAVTFLQYGRAECGLCRTRLLRQLAYLQIAMGEKIMTKHFRSMLSRLLLGGSVGIAATLLAVSPAWSQASGGGSSG